MRSQNLCKNIGALALMAVIPSSVAQVPGPETSAQVAARVRAFVARRAGETARLSRELGTPQTLQLEGRVAVLDHFLTGRDGKPHPVYLASHNANAAKTTRTDLAWNVSYQAGTMPRNWTTRKLTGAGIIMGIWDEAHVEAAHPEFGASAIVGLIGPNTPNTLQWRTGHANHVAGTMVGRGANTLAKGMAFNATIKSGTFGYSTNFLTELAAEAPNLALSNHSYGPNAGWELGYVGGVLTWLWHGGITMTDEWVFGSYLWWDQTQDAIARANPHHLIVRSAGNSFNQGPPPGTPHYAVTNSGLVGPLTTIRPLDGNPPVGYDTVPSLAVSKNILTVGSIDDVLNPSSPYTAVHSSFSSAGPTDDGRIKPDLMGNGQGVFSALLNGTYGNKSGTSMSSPNVCGSLALLVELWKPTMKNVRADFLKALAIHTADDAGATGPDYTFGWGLLNMERATQFASHLRGIMAYNPNKVYPHTMILNKVSQNNKFEVKVERYSATGPGWATLVWADPAGPVQANYVIDPPSAKALINDLDLEIVDPNGTVIHQAWVLNPNSPSAPATKGVNSRDNVEQVWIPALAPGSYTIRVKAGFLQATLPQDFALLLTNFGAKMGVIKKIGP